MNVNRVAQLPITHNGSASSITTHAALGFSGHYARIVYQCDTSASTRLKLYIKVPVSIKHYERATHIAVLQ